MPRMADQFPAQRGGNDIHSPLRGLLDFTSPLDMTAKAAGGQIRQKIEDVVAFIKSTTGVDLSSILDLVDMLSSATGIDLNALGILDPVGLLGNLSAFIPGLGGVGGVFDLPGTASGFITAILQPQDLLATLVGGQIPGLQIPGLDASKITSGLFSFGQIAGLTSAFGGIDLTAGNPIIAAIDASIASIPGAAAVIDTICNALGVSGSGHTLSDMLGALQAIPGANLLSVPAGILTGILGAGAIPGLDASKITTGAFPLGMISGLLSGGSILGSLIPGLPASQITSGVFGGGLIPGLDASKITSGVFGTGLIPGLDISSITTGLLSGGSILPSLIPGLDASKITSGAFPLGMITGLLSGGQLDTGLLSPFLGGLSTLGFLPAAAVSDGPTPNLLANPGFHTGIANWGGSNGGAGGAGNEPIWDTTQGHTDLGSLRWDLTGGSWAYSERIPVQPGQKINGGAWVKWAGLTSIASICADVGFDFWDADGVGVGVSLGFNSIDFSAAGGWTHLPIGGAPTVPPGAASAALWLEARSSTGSMWFDDISVTKSGGVQNGLLPGLFGGGTTLLGGLIPGLDASKITSGIFGTGLIPGLDISKITSGLLSGGSILTSLIPGLDVSKITTGVFGLGMIPSLPASQIGSGVFGTGLIPGLDISKITTGLLSGPTILTSLIPGLDASKITSGSFGQSMIAGLPASLANLLPRNVFNASAAAGSNLVISPDLEDTTIKRYYDSWPVAGTQTEVVYSTEQAHSGTHSLKMTPPRGLDGATWTTDTWLWMVPAPGALGDANLGDIDIKVRPGQKLYMEAWVYPPAANTFSANETVELNFSFRDSTGVLASSAYVEGLTTANTLTPGQWNKLTLLAEVPAGYDHTAPTLEVYNYVDPPAVNNIYYWDDPTVHEVTASQDIIGQLFGGPAILSNLVASVIPGLDASKITSGLFGSSLIPGLDVSKIVSGVFGTGFIPGLPASQITSGSFAAGLIPGLDVSKIVSGVFGLAQIPSLPASQIGSGVFGTGLIPGLDVAKITSGVFGAGFIPGLDVSKITSGTFADSILPGLGTLRDAVAQAINGGAATGYTAAQVKTALQAIPGGNIASAILASIVPALDASKITTGAFGTSLIPNLPASIITSGTFGTGLIPGLDVSKIVSGVFGTGFIPSLDAAKITSGVFGSGLIPALDASKITTGVLGAAVAGVDTVWNTITTGLGGAASTTQAAAQTQLKTINGRVTVLEGKGILTQYTANATWNKPTVGADAVAFTADELFTIICINGGGGGLRAGNSNNCQVKGGISGGYVSKQVKYSALAASYAMTIGTGAAGATAEAAPSLGGVTSFGSLVVGAAGVGAVYKDDGTYAVSVPPGNGGAGCWRATGFPPEYGVSGPFAAGGNPGVGAAGGNGAAAPSTIPSGGAGGGGGGATAGGGFAGGAGGFPGGAGGGGGALSGTTNGAGGAGAAGCIFVIAPH